MKLPLKKMPAKKPKQLPKQLDDSDIITISSDINSSKGVSYSGPGSTVGYDPLSSPTYTINTGGSITVPSTTIVNGGYTIGSASSTLYSTGTGNYNWNNIATTSPNVNISSDGIDMAAGTDIKVDGKSLKEFMSNVEERLAILHPNPELEDRWDQLKELRKQYMELEKDLLEKEKLMKILKEK